MAMTKRSKTERHPCLSRFTSSFFKARCMHSHSFTSRRSTRLCRTPLSRLTCHVARHHQVSYTHERRSIRHPHPNRVPTRTSSNARVGFHPLPNRRA